MTTKVDTHKHPLASKAWFEMLAEEARALLWSSESRPRDFTIVERFTGAPPATYLGEGKILGYRLTLNGSDLELEIGIAPDATGDLTVVVPWRFAVEFGVEPSGPRLDATLADFVARGEASITGDRTGVGFELMLLHDAVVARTIADASGAALVAPLE